MRSWEFEGWETAKTDGDNYFKFAVGVIPECYVEGCASYGEPYPMPIELAGLGEICGGFDESTGGSFPDCE